MIWTELIKDQAFEALIMFACGIALGTLYSLFMFVKTKFPFEFAVTLLEILFWAFAAFFVCGFLRYSSNGEINFHNFLALTFGVLLWQRLFYGKIKC